MTVIYTIWLVVAGLIWLYLLFLARKHIRDHLFKPQVESMDDLGAYTQKLVNAGLGFPLAAITWPLWIPVIALMMGTSFLWDDYLKPYLDAKLFPKKPASTDGGSITIMTGVAGQGKPIDLKGTTFDNRKPEEKGKQTISTTGSPSGSLTLTGGDTVSSTAGTGTISPKGDLRLNEEKEEPPEEEPEAEPEKKEEPKPEKDDFHENANELDVSQTAKEDPAKEK
jgi:hypothetical protein